MGERGKKTSSQTDFYYKYVLLVVKTASCVQLELRQCHLVSSRLNYSLFVCKFWFSDFLESLTECIPRFTFFTSTRQGILVLESGVDSWVTVIQENHSAFGLSVGTHGVVGFFVGW